MNLHLRISHTGLILVAVPLLFEIVFVALLANLLTQQELETQRTERNRAVVSLASDLTQEYLNAGQLIVAWRFSKSDEFLSRYDESLQIIPVSLEKLRNLTQDNQEKLRHVTNLEIYGGRVLSLLNQYRRFAGEGKGGGSLLDRINVKQFRDEIQKAFVPFRREVKALQEEARQSAESTPEAEAARKATWRNFLAIGIAFNIVISVLLAIFFGRNITGRLAVLADNSRRLSKREPLNQPVSGNDEITELDSVFRDMVKALTKAEKEKQEFISMISHDLRSPLTSVRGTLTLISEGRYGKINDSGMDKLLGAEASVDRLIRLINELLEIERIQSGMLPMTVAEASLSALFNAARQALLALEDKHNVLIAIEPTDLVVCIDRDRMLQVIINLLANAIKFSPDDSKVQVSASRLTDGCEIRIKDEGRGIPESKLKTIFDRFSQVDRQIDESLGGSGLGLAICKMIVEAHHGKIGVESVEGKGSTFWIKLPVQTPAPPLTTLTDNRS